MNDWLELHALVDDELSAEERTKVQDQMKTCEKTQAQYRAIHHIKIIVQQKCVSPACEESWKGCVKRLNELDKTRKAEFFVGRYAWGICSVFLCIIAGAAVMNRMNGNSLRTGDVADVAASLAPISAPRSQAPDAKVRWLQDNLDRTMPVKPDRITIVGGAMGHLADGRRIAKADLKDRQGNLDLFVIQSADKLDDVQQLNDQSGYSAGHINNMNCITWTSHGDAFLLVGDRSPDALCQAADSLNAR